MNMKKKTKTFPCEAHNSVGQICPAGVVKMLSDCSYVAAATECLSVRQKAKKRIAGGSSYLLELKRRRTCSL
ncbi:Uncharacterized protein TCM_004171 [Theobroma cacao]|uniref:Uncharacterized protein n=1 Tax=Theobroma cacao TaxID=3641 RepID=A0A061DPB0_THECC|nr:Uncharacterized protein TCM_004171 [Theobroma cacao]